MIETLSFKGFTRSMIKYLKVKILSMLTQSTKKLFINIILFAQLLILTMKHLRVMKTVTREIERPKSVKAKGSFLKFKLIIQGSFMQSVGELSKPFIFFSPCFLSFHCSQKIVIKTNLVIRVY